MRGGFSTRGTCHSGAGRNPASDQSYPLVAAGCSHLGWIRDVEARANGCEECLAMGDSWVHLRLCLTCGHVGCCDSSKNKHATKHFLATRHPIVASLEPGEHWAWCYIDEVTLEPA